MFAENNFVFGLIAIILISHTFAIIDIYRKLKTKKTKKPLYRYFKKEGWIYPIHVGMTRNRDNYTEIDSAFFIVAVNNREWYYSKEDDGVLTSTPISYIGYGLIKFGGYFYLIKNEEEYEKCIAYLEEYLDKKEGK